MWNEKYTVVAGADLSAQQYKFISALGVLAGSETNMFGINQGKPQSGEHIFAVKFGHSRLYMTAACSAGDFIGQSNATSGGGSVVTSGIAFGQVLPGGTCSSGGYAQVTCFGGPTLIAK
jgi:hypothetical protein